MFEVYETRAILSIWDKDVGQYLGLYIILPVHELSLQEAMTEIQPATMQYIIQALLSTFIPEGPSNQDIRTLVPKAIKGMVFGTRVLIYWVLGPSGLWQPARTWVNS